MVKESNESELLKGTLDMLILKCLVAGPRHGYGVAKWIQSTTGGKLTIEEGSLYPALHRMLKHGWLSAEWGLSESNRKAKYYKLTRTGRAQLKQKVGSWESMVIAIGTVLNANVSKVAP